MTGDQKEKLMEEMEAYLEGTLETSGRLAFEKKCAEDAAFAAAFEDFKIAYYGIVKQSRAETKAYLHALEEKPAASRVIFWRYIGLAVAAGLLLVLAVLYLVRTPGEQDLFEKYYSPYPNVVASIERNGGADDPWKKPFQLYEEGKYTEALPLFRQLLKEQPYSPELNLYAGLSLLELDKAGEAIYCFDEVIAQQPDSFKSLALWYGALAKLKLGDENGATEYLTRLLDGKEDFYRKKAEALLDEIRAHW